MADGILEISKVLRDLYETGNIKMLVFLIGLIIFGIILSILIGYFILSSEEKQKEKEYEYNKSIVTDIQMLKDKVKKLEDKENKIC